MENIYQGGDLMLFIREGSDVISIACATNHTLTVSTETADISHKDIKGSWKASIIKSRSWEITTDCLAINRWGNTANRPSYSKLLSYLKSGKELDVYIGFLKLDFYDDQDNIEDVNEETFDDKTGWSSSEVDCGFDGKVIVTNLTLNAPNGDNMTYTATLTGVGELFEH